MFEDVFNFVELIVGLSLAFKNFQLIDWNSSIQDLCYRSLNLKTAGLMTVYETLRSG